MLILEVQDGQHIHTHNAHIIPQTLQVSSKNHHLHMSSSTHTRVHRRKVVLTLPGYILGRFSVFLSEVFHAQQPQESASFQRC